MYLGILRSALIGCSPKRGGVLSAISMAVIPRDQISARQSYVYSNWFSQAITYTGYTTHAWCMQTKGSSSVSNRLGSPRWLSFKQSCLARKKTSFSKFIKRLRTHTHTHTHHNAHHYDKQQFWQAKTEKCEEVRAKKEIESMICTPF